MRLFFAGLFVTVGATIPVFFFSEEKLSAPGGFWLGLLPSLLFVPLCLLALVIFNRRGEWREFGNGEELLREWGEKGLLETRLYRARRAFEVKEWEDEGLHYFLELEGGAVLYLNGQYLYDYAPIDDEKYPEENQPRRFPCTEFAIRWHREKKFFVDMKCGGAAFEPELVAPPFLQKEYRSGAVPEDSQLLTDGSYDEWKARCTAHRLDFLSQSQRHER